MSSAQFPRLAVRTLVGAALLAGGLLPLCGCNNQYSESLRYGLRKDRLVIKAPEKDPPRLDRPGELHEWLASLPVSSAKTDLLDPATVDAKDRRSLESALDALFGTPAHPRVEYKQDALKKVAGEDAAEELATALAPAVDTLQLKPDTLAEGSELYRRHCLHCHGLTGDGQGPTAPWINPHPRDYRLGVFKFTSSKQSTGTRKPTRADLVRTLTHGLEGTAMPAFGGESNSKFGVLPDDQIRKLVSYVIHLSLRGQVEFDTLKTAAVGGLEVNSQSASAAEWAADRLKTIIAWWVQANDQMLQPGPYKVGDGPEARQASIARGYKLFLDPGASGCIKCHMDFGRRNRLIYDSWGTVVRPRDLTEGIFRGGRRPLDLYWRIAGGINGAGMSDSSGSLNADQLWDLVNFVQALPYPAMLPEDIRREIYAETREEPRGGRSALAPRSATRSAAQE